MKANIPVSSVFFSYDFLFFAPVLIGFCCFAFAVRLKNDQKGDAFLVNIDRRGVIISYNR